MREIQGVSGWGLVAPLMGELPPEITKECERCESPIEQLFAAALSLVIRTIPEVKRPTLATQVPIGKYRADIVLTGPHGAPRIVVECDGAKFHKDVAKDTKRTAAIEQLGYRLVRATGSQIHHNPLAMAKVILRNVGFISDQTILGAG